MYLSQSISALLHASNKLDTIMLEQEKQNNEENERREKNDRQNT